MEIRLIHDVSSLGALNGLLGRPYRHMVRLMFTLTQLPRGKRTLTSRRDPIALVMLVGSTKSVLLSFHRISPPIAALSPAKCSSSPPPRLFYYIFTKVSIP
ncbi:hypothetical protein N7G274_000973 [Stereocaulon virgatum]|uniref:Uncharacterized protein n=1 Tax=Stereocaulon virgatum TaxID=373712 RepID=A0ABR4AMI9_9LECA